MASQPEEQLRDWSLADAWKGLNKPVFIPAVLLIVGLLIFAILFSRAQGEDAEAAFDTLMDTIGNTVGWWYVLIATGFVVFALWIGFSKAGSVRLGRDDEKPEFSMMSWFTMLFAAGMGIGLVFWGVAEPLNHYMWPPEVAGVDSESAEAARSAMGQTMFHWGLHAWAIYVVVGLGLAYMTFRRGRPLSMRWLLEPIFGRKLIESWVGHAIDIVAIVGTIFGVVTSLGLGVQQIGAGMVHMGWVSPTEEGTATTQTLSWLVVGITAVATVSVISGLHKGLKWLSNVNMLMAAGIALMVLLLGPTLFIFQSLVSNAGEYAMAFPQLMFETATGYEFGDWTLDWTIYYWGWWMSWAPFVGMFIARISRGRTIREFVLGVLLAPTLIGLIWFSIFGSSGIWNQVNLGNMWEGDDGPDTDTALFTLLDNLPAPEFLSGLLAVVAMVVIALFFITSSDSASLVVDVLSYGGRATTPRLSRLFWAVMEGIATIVLLVAAGEAAGAALRVLQVSSIAAAAPLSIVYVLAVFAMIRMARYESRTLPRYVRVRRNASKAALVGTARERAGTEGSPAVQRNLLKILSSQSMSLRGIFGSTSATLAGLSATKGAPQAQEGGADGDLVLAVQEVPAHATTINPETGVLGWDKSTAYYDPITSEAFETPEYAESNTGWETESEQFFDETVATGTIPAVDPEGQDSEEHDDAK